VKIKNWKAMRQIIIASVFVCIIAFAAYAAITATRFSNPGAVSGQADGLLPGGDRMNSYAWSVETMKNPSGEEYLYVGSNRDLIYLLLKKTSMTDGQITDIFSGDIPIIGSAEDLKASIFRKKTSGDGDWEIIYTSPMLGTSPDVPLDIGYRGVQPYAAPGEAKPSLYFGTMGIATSRLIKIGPDFEPGDTPINVFQTPPGSTTSVRALEVYNYGSGDKLYMGITASGADPADEDLKIMESTDPESNDWKEIASLKKGDFPGAKVDTKTVQYGGIWDMVVFNGYLYAFVGKDYSGTDDDGFTVFKGKPVSAGGNSAGWKWEPVVSSAGGIYPNGMGNKSNATASPFVYNVGGKDYVYVGTFADVISPLSKGFTAILDSMYPCQVYRFDKDDNWEMVVGNPEDSGGLFTTRLGNFGAGFFNAPEIPPEELKSIWPISPNQLSMNQYAWRMGVYKNKLYVTTLDLGVMLDYAKNFTDSQEEKEAIGALVALFKKYNPNPSGFDLYYTSDGINFDPVTKNGFGDKYNYGGRTVRTTPADDAMFIGTANPFYGCQVWKVTDDTPAPEPEPEPSSGGGGCNAGLAGLLLLGIIPLLIYRKKQ